jgi:YihY family inner membrane protein
MIRKIKKLFTSPTHELGRWTRFLVFQVRIWFHCLRLLKVNRCGTQAGALAYHSIFGLVPLAIVGLMVFQMFPANRDLGEKVRDFAYDQMNLSSLEYPSETEEDNTDQDSEIEKISVADKLDELADNFASKASAGAITVVGMTLVIWAAISLLTTTERAFNSIYHVTSGRSFLHRLFNYWALLTLGPILLGVGIYVSTQYVLSNELSKGVYPYIGPVVPFLISVMAFFFLYFFLPNTRVSAGAALWGAFVAVMIWTGAKIAFRWYVTKFVPQFAVYGVLGIIPITVLWIYISWLIVLFGLQLTYAAQNIKRLDAVELQRSRQKETCFLANDQTVVRVMEYVLNAFERKDQKPVSIEAVAHRLSMPLDFTDRILTHMVTSGLLCHTNEPTVGYVPSTDGAHITLDEISKAISEVSFAQAEEKGPSKMLEVFEKIRQDLSAFTLKEVLTKEEDFQLQQELADAASEQEEPDTDESL